MHTAVSGAVKVPGTLAASALGSYKVPHRLARVREHVSILCSFM